MISVDLSNVESIESSNHLYQWDKGQQLEIKGLGVSKAPEIHFGVNGSMLAIVVNSTLSGGIVYADIPNEILMSGKDLRVYVHIDGTTIKNILIPVFKRNMPENYVVDNGNVTWIEEFETEANEITTAKLTEIDRKGTQTLDSIPNDYTALQNDVTELKSDLNASFKNVTFEHEIFPNYNQRNLPKPNGKLYTDYETTQTWFGTEYTLIPNGAKKVRYSAISFIRSDVSIAPIAFYNSNKEFISCAEPKFNFRTQYDIIDIPSDAVYFLQSKYYSDGSANNSENYTYFIYYDNPTYELDHIYKLSVSEGNKNVTSIDFSGFPNTYNAGKNMFTNGFTVTSKTKISKIFVNDSVRKIGVYVSKGKYITNNPSWRCKAESIDVVNGVAEVSLFDIYAFVGDEIYVNFVEGRFKYSDSQSGKSYTAINIEGTRTSVDYLASFNIEYYTNIDMRRDAKYISDYLKKIGTEEIYKYTNNFDDFDVLHGYILANGNFEPDDNWISTEKTPVIAGTSITYVLDGYENIPAVAFYDADKKYIKSSSVITTDQKAVSGIVNVPENAKYVVFVTNSKKVNSAVIKLARTANISESINNINTIAEKSGFNKKIACIGDSLTQGVDVGSHLITENYPYFMSKSIGCRVYNCGRMGTTPKTWWNSYRNSYSFDTSIDVVVIMFGTNGGLTTNSLNTDVEPYDNPADYADTSVGCYCKIIEHIMTSTENKAQIILMTPPHSTYSEAQENIVVSSETTIRAIAKRYALPVIDVLNECGMNKFNGNIFRTHDGCHFNAKGYHKLGTFVGSKLKSMFSEWDLSDTYSDETVD